MKTSTVPSQLLDERVILTMVTCCFISLMILAFRYASPDRYTPLNIVAKDGYTGEIITFAATGEGINTKELAWDFGDNSKRHDKGSAVFHQYATPGRYTVKLTIDGKHYEYKAINISNPPPAPIVQFTGPGRAIVGEPVTFKDFTANATQWEWNFGETSVIDARTQSPTYRFTTAGTKKVTLQVNGALIGKLTIFVDKPEPVKSTPKGPGKRPPAVIVSSQPTTPTLTDQTAPANTTPKIDSPKVAPTPKAPDITTEQMASRLKQVVDGKLTAADFGEYMSNMNAVVIANGQGMPFRSFCDRLSEIKKSKNLKKLEVTNIEKDANTNRIKSMKVKYQTYGLFGKIVH